MIFVRTCALAPRERVPGYVRISQSSVLVEHYHRLPDATWIYRALGPGERLVLESLGCEIAVDRTYLKVFPPPRASG